MSDNDDDTSEFVVQKIIDVRLFDELVQEALDEKIIFNPQSIMKERKRHSKYAYLIDWAGYAWNDRTWEPEANLKDLSELKKFKADRKMPAIHEKFEKSYGPLTWAALGIAAAKVKNLDYLMTAEEKRMEKEEKMRRLREQEEAEKRRNERPRERIVTPEDPEKRRKRRKVILEADDDEIPVFDPDTSNTDFSQDGSRRSTPTLIERSQSASPDSLHSYRQIDSDRENSPAPRQRRPRSPSPPFFGYDDPSESPESPTPEELESPESPDPSEPSSGRETPASSETSSENWESPDSDVESVKSGGTSSPELSFIFRAENGEIIGGEMRRRSSEDSDSESSDDDDDTETEISSDSESECESTSSVSSTTSSSSLSSTSTVKNSDSSGTSVTSEISGIFAENSENSDFSEISDESEISETDEEEEFLEEIPEIQDEEEKLEIQEQMENLQIDLDFVEDEIDQFPQKMVQNRETRDFSTALNLRQLRKCQSSEMLADFFSRNAELEILCRNFELAVLQDPEDNSEDPIFRKKIVEIPENLGFKKNHENPEEKERIDRNWKSILAETDGFELTGNYMKILKKLVICFSRDDSAQFSRIFTDDFPENHLCRHLKYATICFIIAYCDHKYWNADPEGRTLVESESSKTCGVIRQQQKICCHRHRKCAWMKVFLECMPDEVRFTEDSEEAFHGLDEDDGPFRDDVFFHCMREGAECQKRLFFEFGKPIGIQEDKFGDYSLDAMHFLAVQYGNVQKFAAYLDFGLDVNALATHLPTNRVYRLVDYLPRWIRDNMFEGTARIVPDHLDRYFLDLLKMVKGCNRILEDRTKNKVRVMIDELMNGDYKISFEITYPHLLRTSPMNNVSNNGDGANQVLTCLFLPNLIGFRDGLDQIPDAYEENDQKLEELIKKREHFKNLIYHRKGRLILAIFRFEVSYSANLDFGKRFELPQFHYVQSDDDMRIDKVSILRQAKGLDADEADIELEELPLISTPGCKYYGCIDTDEEANLIVPGNAHIEICGEFAKPISFVTQIFFLKRRQKEN